MNPCITIDVSKESSHVQGFLDLNTPITKPKKIVHTKEGFAYINFIFNLIKEKANIEPTIYFEYTGVYDHTLRAYLKSQNLKFIPIPPLVAAKVRKSDLRVKKTDSKDCQTISYVYYENKIKTYYEPTKEEKYLRDLQKHYTQLEDMYQKITVHLHEYLDMIFPFYSHIFSEFDSFNSLKFLFEFPHPDLITSHRLTTLIKKYKELSNHSLDYSTSFVNKLLAVLDNIVPGCDKDDYSVSILKSLAQQALSYKTMLTSVLNQMIQILNVSDKKSLVDSIVSIPGVGKNTAVRFVAEIMNLNRFKSHKSLIAFAGSDPSIEQSGKVDGKHLSITKCGNKRLRTILFLMVRSMIRNKVGPNQIHSFYKRKTQLGLHPKVVLVACVNKLLGIIYQLNKNGVIFTYN